MAIENGDLDSALVKDSDTGKALMGVAIMAGTITLNAGDITVESDVTIIDGTVHVEPGTEPLVAKVEPGTAPIHAIVDSGAIAASIPSRSADLPLGLVKVQSGTVSVEPGASPVHAIVDSGNIVVDSITAQIKAFLDSQASFSGDAVLTTDYAGNYITAGKAFEFQRRIALSANQTLYLEFNISLAVGKFVYSLPIKASTNTGNVFIDTYLADSSSGGSLVAVNNLNGLSVITPQTTVKTGVTVTGTPTKLREYSVGTIKTVQSGGGGAAPNNFPKILDNTKPMYFKIANQESSAVVLDLGFVWFEI